MIEPADDQARSWAMAAHLSALSGLVIPFGNILGPLLVWLLKGKEHPYIDDQAKEALNFQISMTIYMVVSAILILVLIGILLLIGLAIADVVLTIMAAVATREGREYRYPLTFRFIA